MTGIGAAEQSQHQLLLSATAALVSGALSMAVGEVQTAQCKSFCSLVKPALGCSGDSYDSACQRTECAWAMHGMQGAHWSSYHMQQCLLRFQQVRRQTKQDQAVRDADVSHQT